MPTPEEDRFNEYVQDQGLGKRLDIDAMQDPVAQWLKERAFRARHLIQIFRNHHARLPAIHFDWIDSSALNAWAWRHKDSRCIGVTVGAWKFLRTLLSRLMSHPQVLPYLGRASHEDASRVAQLPVHFDAVQNVAANVTPVEPIDPVRRQYVVHLENICFEYLVAHELIHILDGHVDYMNDRFGIPFVAEFAWQRGTPIPPLTNQALEMGADSGAAWTACNDIRCKMTIPELIPAPPWDDYYITAATAFFHWSFGVSSFLRVFGDESLDGVGDATQLDYPPWRVRHQIAMVTAMNYLRRNWDPELVPECAKAVIEAVWEAERGFEHLTGTPREASGLQHTYSGAGGQLIDVLQGHWKNELRAELQPFAFTDDLPFPDEEPE